MNTRRDQKDVTDRLAVLSEMVRLRILRLLEREELSVGEVARVLQLPQSTVSRHLKVLAEGLWTIKRTEGTATLYRMLLDDLDDQDRALWITVRDQLGESAELDEDMRRLASILRERRADSQSFFGRVAGQWDDVRTELFGNRFTMHALLALIPQDWVIADIGCGTGNVSEFLSPFVREVIAVDRSAPMLKAARKRLGGAANVRFERGEMSALPLEDGSVDACVSGLVLHHVDDIESACSEMFRVMRGGGRVLIIDMVAHDRESYHHTMGHRWLGFDEEQMTSVLLEAGFVNPRVVVLPSAPDAKGPGIFACSAEKPARQN